MPKPCLSSSAWNRNSITIFGWLQAVTVKNFGGCEQKQSVSLDHHELITRSPVFPLREAPAAEPSTWNLLGPLDSFPPFTPKRLLCHLTCILLMSHLSWTCVPHHTSPRCSCQSSACNAGPSCAQEGYLGRRSPKSEHLLMRTSKRGGPWQRAWI